MLATMFVSGGYEALRHPATAAPAAESVALPLTARADWLPKDPEQLVRINGAVQLTAGTLLALGRLPRLSALALAATLVPATLAGHPYWTIEDPDERARQRAHFVKNVSMLGGLLVAAADTHGKPSLVYRSRQGTRHAVAQTAHQANSVASAVREHLPAT